MGSARGLNAGFDAGTRRITGIVRVVARAQRSLEAERPCRGACPEPIFISSRAAVLCPLDSVRTLSRQRG